MKLSKKKLLILKKKKQQLIFNNYKPVKKLLRCGRIKGTSKRPRFSIYRSNMYLYVQIIDDSKGHTLLSCTTRLREFKILKKNDCTCSTGKFLGQEVAKRSLKKNIKKVVFDRGPYLYHGKIKAIAEGARIGGLEF